MRTKAGVTILEVVLALAITLTLTVGFVRIATPAPSRRAADAYVHAAHAQRLAALLTGTTKGLRYDPVTMQFVKYTGDGACNSTVGLPLTMARGVTVTRSLRNGIVWLPSGSGRSCLGGGVYGGRVRFEDDREAWDVIVASSGRLRTERSQ